MGSKNSDGFDDVLGDLDDDMSSDKSNSLSSNVGSSPWMEGVEKYGLFSTKVTSEVT